VRKTTNVRTFEGGKTPFSSRGAGKKTTNLQRTGKRRGGGSLKHSRKTDRKKKAKRMHPDPQQTPKRKDSSGLKTNTSEGKRGEGRG